MAEARKDIEYDIDDDGNLYIDGELEDILFPDLQTLHEDIWRDIVRDAWAWKAYRARQTERSKKGAATRHSETSRERVRLRDRVEQLRLRHPDYSDRAVARLLLPSDKRSDARAVAAMAAKIRRHAPRE